MDWSPVAELGCVGGEIGMSSEPSSKKMEPVVRSAVFGQSIGMEQNACAGSSIGITVLILPADLIMALIAPPAPCECPNDPTWLTFSLSKKILTGLLFAAIRKLTPSNMVCPGPAFLSSGAMITNPHEAMCFKKNV